MLAQLFLLEMQRESLLTPLSQLLLALLTDPGLADTSLQALPPSSRALSLCLCLLFSERPQPRDEGPP